MGCLRRHRDRGNRRNGQLTTKNPGALNPLVSGSASCESRPFVYLELREHLGITSLVARFTSRLNTRIHSKAAMAEIDVIIDIETGEILGTEK